MLSYLNLCALLMNARHDLDKDRRLQNNSLFQTKRHKRLKILLHKHSLGSQSMTKKYYAERKGAELEPVDLESLKQLFLLKFEELYGEFYFREATGYECVDKGTIPGLWGSNPEAFFFLKLRMRNLWPIRKYINDYDEKKLFTIIEFLYDYVSEPQEKEYHSWNDCGWHTSNYDKVKGRAGYRTEMNGILKDYKSGYVLSEMGEVQECPPDGLELVFEEIKTDDPKNIDDRIRLAISKFRRYNATLDEKKDAVRTLGDVLEFLKKEGTTLPTKDDSDLFNILNNFDIRHHNREQKKEYDKEIWYDWLFYTLVASINLLLKFKDIKETS